MTVACPSCGAAVLPGSLGCAMPIRPATGTGWRTSNPHRARPVPLGVGLALFSNIQLTRAALAILAVLMISLPAYPAAAQSGLCAAGCGNQCYGRPAGCESACIRRCSMTEGSRGSTSIPSYAFWNSAFVSGSGSNFNWAASWGYPNPSEARARALQDCSKFGPVCQELATGYGRCVAIVEQGKDGHVVGVTTALHADTAPTAASAAMINCHAAHPDLNCHLHTNTCSR
jgi:hypothetical protein